MRIKAAFLFIIASFVVAPIFAAPKYRIVDLDIPKDVQQSRATSINDRGQICGTYQAPNVGSTVFFWDPNTGFQDVGAKGASLNPIINNKGVIAGDYHKSEKEGCHHSIFLWDRRNGFSDIGLPACRNQGICDMNNLNQVLFVYQNDKDPVCIYADFCSLGNLFSYAKINDQSKIFGYETAKNGTVLRIFDPKTSDYEDIFFFKGHCTLRGFNNKEIAIGEIETSYGNRYGFTWSPEKGIELSDTFFPICMNDKGQIVGYEYDNRRSYWAMRLTVQDNGTKFNINESLELEFDPSTPWSCIAEICDINNQGYMVGTGRTANGQSRAVLLVPVN